MIPAFLSPLGNHLWQSTLWPPRWDFSLSRLEGTAHRYLLLVAGGVGEISHSFFAACGSRKSDPLANSAVADSPGLHVRGGAN
jgi:hypothetical protein